MNVLDTLKNLSGYWHYEGGKYLAKLTSGKVSDVYVNCSKITGNTPIMEAASFDLLCKLRDQISADRKIAKGTKPCRDLMDWLQPPVYVCGPAFGGITMAYNIALGIGAEAIFTEPVYENGSIEIYGQKTFMPASPRDDSDTIQTPKPAKTGQELKRFELLEGATVLFVDDIITTGKRAREMIEAVCTCPSAFEWGYGEAQPLWYVLCLVNLSGVDKLVVKDHYDCEREFKIISLADITARTWDTVEEARSEIFWGKEVPDADPSFTMEAVHPGDNWELLTKGE